MQIAPHDTTFERHLQFDGCFNFRDLGAYRTRDGHTLRSRRLFRADGPHALTDADGAMLRALSVATVLDLRTTDEAAERGHYSTAVPDVLTYALPMTDVLPDFEELPTWTDPAGRREPLLRDARQRATRRSVSRSRSSPTRTRTRR